ncbi:MAG: hypothetical protein GY765_33760 [bacterium]|nr:hypothetical protein [bacterium]
MKIDKNGLGKVLKTVVGRYKLLVGSSDTLFLFNRDDYFVLPVAFH